MCSQQTEIGESRGICILLDIRLCIQDTNEWNSWREKEKRMIWMETLNHVDIQVDIERSMHIRRESKVFFLNFSSTKSTLLSLTFSAFAAEIRLVAFIHFYRQNVHPIHISIWYWHWDRIWIIVEFVSYSWWLMLSPIVRIINGNKTCHY